MVKNIVLLVAFMLGVNFNSFAAKSTIIKSPIFTVKKDSLVSQESDTTKRVVLFPNPFLAIPSLLEEEKK